MSEETKKMILSIQLINADSGDPIVDKVITGNGLELRDQMTELLGQSILGTSLVNGPQHEQVSQLPHSNVPVGGNNNSDVKNGDFSLVAPPPMYSSEGGFAGGDGSADPNYKLSGANAGIQGGERTRTEQVGADGVAYDNSLNSGRTGNGNNNNDRPPTDSISVDERTRQIQQQQSLGDGGGSRVNRESNARNYELGNYETGVMINPDRHQFDSNAVQEAERRKAPTLDSVGVPYEVAGVTSKIKNIHRVGGERVKEMDHFVAAVSTPVVDVLLTGPDGKLVKAKRDNDVGTHVGISTRDAKLGRSAHVFVDARGAKWPILVEEAYNNLNDGGRKQSEISGHAAAFIDLIHDVFFVLNLSVQEMPESVQFYYMTTLRMDELVCCMSPSKKKLFLNVQAFQQQMYTDAGAPMNSIRQNAYSEALSSWITRVHLAIRDEQWSSIKWIKRRDKRYGDPCMGLYDVQNRMRYEGIKENKFR